jgi:hypothetical protein
MKKPCVDFIKGIGGGTCAALATITTAALALSACASGTARQPGVQEKADTTADVAQPNAQIPRIRIRDWSVPNDHTIIVVSDDGTRYRAQTIGPCTGLNFTNRLAFVNRGGFQQIDRFSSVVLDDGTRCTFQSFDKLAPPEKKALDSYEQSKEAEAAEDATKDEAAKGAAESPK